MSSPTAPKPLPPQELLLKLLRYEPETGKLFWRERPREMFSADRFWRTWNTRYAGKEAFTSESYGYRQGTIDGERYFAHRLILRMVTGCEPDIVDHTDGDPANNKIRNLRSGTSESNSRNMRQRLCRISNSGHTGVRWKKSNQKWLAYIGIEGRNRHVGLFETKEEAIAARREAERNHGFHPNHGRRKR